MHLLLTQALLLAFSAGPADAPLQGCEAARQRDGWMYVCKDRGVWAQLHDPPRRTLAEARKELAEEEGHVVALIVNGDSPAVQERARALEAEESAVKAKLGTSAEVTRKLSVSVSSRPTLLVVLLPRPEGVRTLTCDEPAPGRGCLEILSVLATQPWRPAVIAGTKVMEEKPGE